MTNEAAEDKGLYTVLHLKSFAGGTKATVRIPVLVKSYAQSTTPKFASTEVYGRMDPIFTYQNTKRTFEITFQTPQKNKLKKCGPGSGHDAATGAGYVAGLPSLISSIYAMMYPLYETETHGSGADAIKISRLKSPPLLEIKVPKVLGGPSAKSSIIFVPEKFSVQSGLADSNEINFVMGDASAFRYLAPAGGYGFTLGGTILHRGDPPGFEVSGTTVSFTKKHFPLNTIPSILNANGEVE